MRVGPLAYRLAMLALAALGAGVAVAAHVTDTINRYYFQTHYPGGTILFWSGVVIAVVAAVEGATLVVRRRLKRTA